MKNLVAIVAATTTNGIGFGQTLPWRLSKEMAYFARVTKHVTTPNTKNVVIMGRKTWEGIPKKFRPLGERINVVVSRTGFVVHDEDSFALGSMEEASQIANKENVHKAFLIGGAQLYAYALSTSSTTLPLTHILLTRIHTPFECDVYFPALDSDWVLESEEQMDSFVGFEVPRGIQTEIDKISGKTVEYTFELWAKKSS